MFRSTFTTGTGAPTGPPVQSVVAASGEPYAVSTMQVGAPIYVDRDYTYGSYPSRFEGQPYILTANDDKFATGDPFLSFSLGATSTVCVLFDDRATQLRDPARRDPARRLAAGARPGSRA